MDAPQSISELNAKLVQLKADLLAVEAEQRQTATGTLEYGRLNARHQQLTNDYDRTQRLLKGLRQGRQTSLL